MWRLMRCSIGSKRKCIDQHAPAAHICGWRSGAMCVAYNQASAAMAKSSYEWVAICKPVGTPLAPRPVGTLMTGIQFSKLKPNSWSQP